MHRKIYGFLEVIDEETFEMLRFQKHPSLYEDYRHVDEDDPHFTPKKKYFIIFGALSCVNSDVGLPIKFSHRDRSCAYEDNLKWELVFSRETVDCEIDNIESYEIIYDIDVIEVKERDGISATVGDVLYSRPRKVHSVTHQTNLYKYEYFYRVYFGSWTDVDHILDYKYEKNQEVRINYNY